MKSIKRTPYPTLEVVRLGRSEWRVSAASERGLLLGYVERLRADRFEVLWMSDPIRWGYTSTFDDAMAAFAGTGAFVGEVFPARAPSDGRASRFASLLSW